MRLRRLCLVVCAAVVLPGFALAQDTPPDLRDTVDDTANDQQAAPAVPQPPPQIDETQRPRRKLARRGSDDGTGLRLGGLIAYPSVEIGVIASSNGAMSATDAISDVALRVAPALRLQSDWSRHEFDASAKLTYQKSIDTGDLTSLSAGSRAHLRLDIRRSTQADLEAAYDVADDNDPNRDLATGAAKPRRDHSGLTQVSLRHDFGPWFGEAAIGASALYAENVRLNNGSTENNKDRAYVQPKYRLRAGLSNGAIWRPFAEASYDPRYYLKKTDRNGVRRDSDGYTSLLGLEFDDSDIWKGSIAAAYTLRDYAAPGLDTEHAFGIEAHGTWQPQQATAIDLNSTVGLQDNFSNGSTAVRVWAVDLALSHALTDTLKLSAGTGLTIEDGAGGTDATYSARLGAEWQLNPFFALSGEVGGTWFDAAAKADSYDEQHASVGAVIRR